MSHFIHIDVHICMVIFTLELFFFLFLLFSIAAVLYDGRQEERKAIKEELLGEGKFSVLITHYDLIMRDKAFLKKIHWYYMIVDEGHRLKNRDCALAQTLAGYDSYTYKTCPYFSLFTYFLSELDIFLQVTYVKVSFCWKYYFPIRACLFSSFLL